MIGSGISPALIVGGLAVPLIGALSLAIRRSTRRQECARLRDLLVDAARAGELDVGDWRVFSLIDWFDQVAATGRTDTVGRHGPDRPDPADSLACSLAGILLPLGQSAPAGASWPEPAQPDAIPDLRAVAVHYRERHQQRLGARFRRPAPARPRVALTGRPEPRAALVPLAGWVRVDPATFDQVAGDQVGFDLRTPASSLVEEIFAVAGTGR